MKKHKNIRFSINLFLILIAVYLTTTLYIHFFPLNYNNPNNTRIWLVNKTLDKQYDLSDSSISVLFVGDSRLNAAIDYRLIKNSWSFGIGGATPIEIYYLTKKYIKSYQSPATIFVSISPRFMTEIFAFWDLAVRNDFFTNEEFQEISTYSKKYDDTIKINIIKFILYRLNCPIFYQDDLRNNLIVFGKEENLQLIEYIMNNRGRRPHFNLKNTCSELNYEAKNMGNFTPLPIFDLYFDKILKLCQEEQIMCVFLAMPMNESSFNVLKTDFVKDYQKYMQQKQVAFPKFLISDSLYSYPDSLFGDASHLNSTGTKIFTNSLYTFLHLKKNNPLFNTALQ